MSALPSKRILEKGKACLTCKTRKVRCDGVKPACSACKRSARFRGEDAQDLVCSYFVGRRCSTRAGPRSVSGGTKRRRVQVAEDDAPQPVYVATPSRSLPLVESLPARNTLLTHESRSPRSAVFPFTLSSSNPTNPPLWTAPCTSASRKNERFSTCLPAASSKKMDLPPWETVRDAPYPSDQYSRVGAIPVPHPPYPLSSYDSPPFDDNASAASATVSSPFFVGENVDCAFSCDFPHIATLSYPMPPLSAYSLPLASMPMSPQRLGAAVLPSAHDLDRTLALPLFGGWPEV